MIDTIIFDYDGVIVDSFPTVHEVYQEICAELGVDCPDDIEEFRRLYGYTAKELKHNLGISEWSEWVDRQFAQRVVMKEPALFTGIDGVIKELHTDYRLLLATSNMKEEAHQKLAAAGLDTYFTQMAGDERDFERNTVRMNKSDQIAHWIDAYNVTPEQVISVGDRVVDYDIAKKLSIPNIILCAYGWGLDRDKVPDAHIIDRPSEIRDAVNEIVSMDSN